MFNNYYRPLSLAGIDSAKLSSKELRSLVRQILDAKIHGISFSPYVEGQGPGTLLGEEQIRERLAERWHRYDGGRTLLRERH